MSKPPSIAEAFDIFNSARVRSTVLEEIWAQAYGKDYAIDAKPDGFYPQSVLDRITATAKPQNTGRALLDIGCGHGRMVLYLAQYMELKPSGIDVSAASIDLATRTALDRRQPGRFWVADASSTGLEDSTCALVTCLDVLLYLPDKPAFCKEMYRIIEPDGLFAFTTWEQQGYSARLGAQQVEDYRPLLKEAGFEIEDYDVVKDADE